MVPRPAAAPSGDNTHPSSVSEDLKQLLSHISPIARPPTSPRIPPYCLARDGDETMKEREPWCVGCVQFLGQNPTVKCRSKDGARKCARCAHTGSNCVPVSRLEPLRARTALEASVRCGG